MSKGVRDCVYCGEAFGYSRKDNIYCSRTRCKSAAWRKTNPERFRELCRKSRRRSPEAMRQNIERSKEWREKNHDRYVAGYMAYNRSAKRLENARKEYNAKKDDPEDRARRRKHENKYNVSEKGHIRARRSQKLYRLREKLNGGTLAQADIQQLLAKSKGRCYYCGDPLNGQYHIEHRIPVSRGGTSGKENLVIACPPCNRGKGARTDVEFIVLNEGGFNFNPSRCFTVPVREKP